MRTVRRFSPVLVVALCWPGAALAGAGAIAAEAGWTFDPWVVGPLLLSGVLYLAGTAALWSRAGAGRGVRPWQVVCYGAGLVALAGALTSPLHAWGERLFTAHMIEHEIIMAVAAPLMAVARPIGSILWALPRPVRLGLGAAGRHGAVRAVWSALTRPAVATILHGVAIWIWHIPALLDATVADTALHRLQHLAFLVTALLFWWALVRRADPGAACVHLFATMTHTGLLGALIALTPRVLYPGQTAGAALCGLSPLEDQQLAGLVMWIPAGTVYAGAALAFATAWIRRSRPLGLPRHAHP